MLKHFPHFAHGNFLGRRYFLFSLYSLVTNLLCTGTATGLITGGSLFEVEVVGVSAMLVSLMLGLSGTNAAFSAIGSSSGGGISSLRDRSVAMAVFVSSSVASMVTIPIVGCAASVAVEIEEEAFASVQDTCTCVFLVIVSVFPADRGDINLRFLWASRTVFDGLCNRFGLQRLCGGVCLSVGAASWE